jgi:hypothetical protein
MFLTSLGKNYFFNNLLEAVGCQPFGPELTVEGLSAVSLKNRPLTEGFRRDVLQDRVNAAYKNWSSTLFLSHQ